MKTDSLNMTAPYLPPLPIWSTRRAASMPAS
nr:MAG TPA: hypothetical protein [Caudoviricetes sp.]